MALGLAHSKLRNQVTTMVDFHARINQGLAFSLGHIDLALTAAGTISILLRINVSHLVHMTPRFSSGGESKLEIFEEPIVTVDGSLITPINFKRSSDYFVVSSFTLNPAIATDGVLLDTEIIADGSGGTERGSDVWILGPNKLYEFRLTNLSSLAKIVNLHLDFYETAIEGAADSDVRYVDDDYVDTDYVEGTQ